MFERGAGIQFSEGAKDVLDFLYRFWGEHRRPPNLADVHRSTGLAMRDIRRVYRELMAGFAISFDDWTLNLGLKKVTPFSATPTSVLIEHHGWFHSYVGCPAEAITVSAMPMFHQSVLTVRSSCECCYEPIELQIKNMEIVASPTPEPLVSMVGSPYEWEHGVSADRVCDSIHFVLDASHARRYEEQVNRTGITLTLAQLRDLGSSVAKRRMWDRDLPPIWIDGQKIVEAYEAAGVDVSPWR
jgi:hypothetical protein